MWERREASCGNALFEVTLCLHPQAWSELFRRRWCAHAVWTLLPVAWVISACLFQVSIGMYGGSLPLYPLPLALAYVAWHRGTGMGIFLAAAGGMAYDALTFGSLGTHSVILCVVWWMVLCLRLHLGWALRQCSWYPQLLGGLATCVYVLSKLFNYCLGSPRGDVLSYVPVYLFLGLLLNSFMLAPIQWGLYGFVERRLHRQEARDSEADEDGEGE